MRRPSAVTLILTGSVLAAPLGPAQAQATPDGARALEGQLQKWLAAVFGADRPMMTAPASALANGDHYDLVLPLFEGADGPRLTSTARDQGGGRWAMSELRQSTPATFQLSLPQPPTADGKPARMADVTYQMTIGAQTGEAVIDTSLATASRYTSSADDLTVSSSWGSSPSTTHVDHLASVITIGAGKDPGRMDGTMEASLTNYRVSATSPNLGSMKILAGETSVRAAGTDFSVGRLRDAMHAEFDFLLSAMQRRDGTGTMAAPPDPVSALTMVEALIDTASSASIEQRSESVSITLKEVTAVMRELDLGFGAKATDGLSSVRFELGMDGLDVPDVGLGPAAGLIPTKVALRPTLSGMPSAALLALLRVLKAGQVPAPEQIEALFARGPITAGLEAATVEVAGASFSGQGLLEIASLDSSSGSAQVTATGYDLLQQQVAAAPSMSAAGLGLIFLKGIGRAEDERMVWDVVYRDGHVLVNGTNMSAMAAPPRARQ